ncbi:MAG: hypothetical protein ACQESN_07560 [Thermotogota bacterium]
MSKLDKIKSVKLIITVCLLIFIIFLIFTLFNISNIKDYQYKIDFFQFYLKSHYGLKDIIIKDFVEVFEMLNENRSHVVENVTPLEMLAIGIKETNFRNVKGDGDDSLGFFQVQEPTYWFVKHKHNDLFLKINFYSLPWIWDNVRIRPDAQLLTAILYLDYLKERFSEDVAFSHYNGGNMYYQQDIMVMIDNINNKYKQYKTNKEMGYYD